MSSRASLATLCVVVAALVAAVPANASTRLGSQCTASVPGGGLSADPATGTASADGVITTWGVGFPGAPYTSELIVLAPNGANNWTIAQASSSIPLSAGINATAARIPIKAGQLIAMQGSPSATFCAATTSTALTANPASFTVGSAVTTAAVGSPYTATIWADVEPDVDADGFGDETQDKCPQSAAFQIACPTPKPSIVRIPSTSDFRLVITTDIAGTVKVAASVKLPASSGKKSKTLKFQAKAANTAPGKLTQVKLKYPSSLKRALAALSSRKTLTLKVTVTVPGVLSTSTKKYSVKLHGTK